MSQTPPTSKTVNIEAIRFLAAGQDDPQSAAIAECADEIERLRGRVAELSRALASCRAQWIHSVNAKRCLKALGEDPYDPAVMAEVRAALSGEHSAVETSEHRRHVGDLLSEFAMHVGTGTALGPVDGAWYRREADWRERELRDFIASLAAELRLYRQTATDPERIAIADALLSVHPELTGSSSKASDNSLAPSAQPVATAPRVGLAVGANPLIGAAAQPSPGTWGIFCQAHGFTEWHTICPQCQLSQNG